MRDLPQEVVTVGAALVGAALCLFALAPGPALAEPGDAARGAQLFAGKQCTRCHAPQTRMDGGGPPLEELRRPQGAWELAGRMWNHAPVMFAVLARQALRWPEINPAEMADLMAYLEASPARDPRPNLLRGHDVLVTKGCLKCHAWRGEGGRVAEDLVRRRQVFAHPAEWAATIWSHSPRMAALAQARGILYPRFTGEEMVDLVGFIRAGSSR